MPLAKKELPEQITPELREVELRWEEARPSWRRSRRSA